MGKLLQQQLLGDFEIQYLKNLLAGFWQALCQISWNILLFSMYSCMVIRHGFTLFLTTFFLVLSPF